MFLQVAKILKKRPNCNKDFNEDQTVMNHCNLGILLRKCNINLVPIVKLVNLFFIPTKTFIKQKPLFFFIPTEIFIKQKGTIQEISLILGSGP